jgi:hypothetical protein
MSLKPPPIPGDSYISVSKCGTAYVGADATMLFRVTAVQASLRLWMATGILPYRHIKLKDLLNQASMVTKTIYPASRNGASRACDDLRTWIVTMRAALPLVKGD